jgi:hypothetical protein
MSAITNGSLQPTWFGHVQTSKDALILFEACLNGTLHHVPRRPHDRERSGLIKSGCVFIYEENASGIKRWTDGVPWSPSRILGNFLVYRELVKPFPPGEKKRATKKAVRTASRSAKPGEPYPRTNSTDSQPSITPPGQQTADLAPEDRESERALIGSLIDSYGFKEGGLVKKTMSVNVHGVHHHLVSYYTIDDASGDEPALKTPANDRRLVSIEPRHDLVARQSFRAPLDETDDGEAYMLAGGHPGGYQYGATYRPDLMLGHQSVQGGPIGMTYAGMPMSSSTFSPSMQSYAPTQGLQQNCYTASSAMPTNIKQDPYGSYSTNGYGSMRLQNLSISTDRHASLPQLGQYSYRGPTTPQSARPSLGGSHGPPSSQDARPLDPASWDRSGTPTTHGHVYAASSTPQPHSAGPYQTHNPQWGLPAGLMPRTETQWTGTEGSWQIDPTSATRHHTYQTAPQPNL